MLSLAQQAGDLNTTKNHLVCDGKGRALAFILTPGQAADTSMLAATLTEIRVLGAQGRPRSRPDQVLADKGQQRERYKGRNVIERCFNKLKQRLAEERRVRPRTAARPGAEFL
ncbi:transposase [Sinomonas cellulolyticus]|uniref:Transposase n=1 Tax=Sinomonas cellulolyticus TaxID=2801916 RepID=A0ABS1K619_9MICC|nr:MULTISPECIES: transposase [Sinomonas]MBL0707115.1 transposase [Sinomonas cellulolyticus]